MLNENGQEKSVHFRSSIGLELMTKNQLGA